MIPKTIPLQRKLQNRIVQACKQISYQDIVVPLTLQCLTLHPPSGGTYASGLLPMVEGGAAEVEPYWQALDTVDFRQAELFVGCGGVSSGHVAPTSV